MEVVAFFAHPKMFFKVIEIFHLEFDRIQKWEFWQVISVSHD